MKAYLAERYPGSAKTLVLVRLNLHNNKSFPYCFEHETVILILTTLVTDIALVNK